MIAESHTNNPAFADKREGDIPLIYPEYTSKIPIIPATADKREGDIPLKQSQTTLNDELERSYWSINDRSDILEKH